MLQKKQKPNSILQKRKADPIPPPLAVVRIHGESQEEPWFALQRGLSRGGFTLLQIADVNLV
jgi:hypothetical protein